jgi:hypothetical protein
VSFVSHWEFFVTHRPATRRPSRARIVLAALATLATGGVLVAGLSAPASASPTIDVTVKVTSKSGTALSHVSVFPFAMNDGNPLPTDDFNGDNAATPIPGKTGYYDLGQLDADQLYTLNFAPEGSSIGSSTFSQWLGGVTDSQRATTFTPSEQNFVSTSLATNATITGKVEGPSGSASAGAFVEAYMYENATWFERASATANSKGVYTITDLDPGSYELEFYPKAGNYAPIFSGGARTLDDATASSASATYVSVGKSATVNAKFVNGSGTASGVATVSNESGNGPDSGMTPVAIPVTGGTDIGATGSNFDLAVYGAPSNKSGGWGISGIPDGRYVIKEYPGYFGETLQYVGFNKGGATSLADARIFTFSGKINFGGLDTVTSVSISDGGVLPINITDNANHALSNAQVTLTEVGNPYNEIDTTTGNIGGFAELGYPVAIEPGEYDLTIVDPTEQNEPVHMRVVIGFDQNPTLNVQMTATSPAPGFVGTPSLTQTGSQVGDTFTAVATASRTDEGADALAYQWLRDGVPIYGANGPTYTATGGDVGSIISVRISTNSFGFATRYATPAATEAIQEGAAAEPSGDAPTITSSGDFSYGHTLTATPGGWTGSGWTYHYQWLSGGFPSGPVSTSPTHLVSAFDARQQSNPVTVDVTATREGFASDPATFARPAQPVYIQLSAAPTATTQPTVSAKKSGSNTVYTVKSGKWSLAGVTLSYSWGEFVEGVFTPEDATSSKYSRPTNTGADAQPVLAIVTASKPGYLSASASVVAVKGTGTLTQQTPETVQITHDGKPAGTVPGAISVGDTLTAAHGTWVDPNGSTVKPSSYKYSWLRVGDSKVVSTASKYTLTPADLGDDIQLIETAVSSGFSDSVAPGVDVGTVAPGTSLNTAPASLTISGTVSPGLTVTAKVGPWSIPGVTNHLQWYGCQVVNVDDPPGTDCHGPSGDAPFSGATSASFTVPSQGTYSAIYVVNSPTATGYVQRQTKSAYAPVVYGTITKSPTVALTGGQYVVTPGTYAPDPATTGVPLQYTWYVNGVPDGTTGTTHPDVAASSALWVDVTYQDGSAKHVSHLVAHKGTLFALVDSINGSAYGQTLTPSSANPFEMSPGSTPLTLKYQWYYLSGSTAKSISGATKASYTPGSTYVGKTLEVKITGSSDEYNSGSDIVKMTAPLGANTFTPTSDPHLTFTAPLQSGTVATVVHGAGYPTGTTFTYQWQRGDGENFTTISGATKSTYTPATADAGLDIRAVVTAKKTAYTPLASYTAAQAVDPGAPLAVVTPPSISDSVVGHGLVANVGTWNKTHVTFTYQWYRNEASSDPDNPLSRIPGATDATYVIPGSAYKDELRVDITAHKDGFADVTVSSNVIVVGQGEIEVFDPAKITAKGSVYSVSSPTWSVTGLTYRYQWKLGGVPITGATADTYTRAGSDSGVLSVDITASAPGYADDAVTVTGPKLTAAM